MFEKIIGNYRFLLNRLSQKDKYKKMRSDYK